MEYLIIIKEVFITMAALVTAIVAIVGLKSWSSELKGRTNFETARKLIRDTYKLRDELKYSRAPFTMSNEYPDNYNFQNPSKEEEIKAWSYILRNRWNPILNSLQEFEAQSLEAESLWGNKIKEICFELRRCATRLNSSMASFVELKNLNSKELEHERELFKNIKADIWVNNKEDDELSQKIVEAIKNIENAVLPYLKR